MKALLVTAILILLFNTVLYFKHPLKIILFKFLYGGYHINYLRLFYNEDYFSNEYLYDQISAIRIALKKSEKYSSNLPTYFQNIKYGISSKELISIIGKPVSYDVISLGSEKIVSLEYNIEPSNVVDKYVYYFRNDAYYMGEFHFNKVKEETTNEILTSINAKYKTHFTEIQEFVICNRNGNHLSYNDMGFKTVVSYFNKNNPNIKDLLIFQDEYMKIKKAEYTYQLNIQQLSF